MPEDGTTGRSFRPVPMIVTLVGFASLSLGILCEYLLDKWRLSSTEHGMRELVEHASEPVLLFGLVLSFFGTIAWARRFSRSGRIGLAALIIYLLILTSFFVHANIHDGWSIFFAAA